MKSPKKNKIYFLIKWNKGYLDKEKLDIYLFITFTSIIDIVNSTDIYVEIKLKLLKFISKFLNPRKTRRSCC